jgi:D-alanyl-D-alanine carboxypeptidase
VRLSIVLLVAAALAASGSGCGSSGNRLTLSSLVRPDLQRELRELTREQHDGAVALMETSEGVWRGASGFAVGRRPAKPENRFKIASITKTFVATVVLQLVSEGRLSLDDSADQWIPRLIREGRRITVRQLLNHTSGLPGDVSLSLTSRERLAQNASGPLLSRPGTAFSYSNMNFVALGLIVERVTRRPLSSVVRDRIFRPLHLDDTSYGTAAAGPQGNRAPAWLGIPDEASGPVSGDSGIVSSTDDLAKFFQALLRGELLREDTMSEMTQTIDTGEGFRVGLGFFREDLSCGSVWYHAGDAISYSAMALAAPDGSKAVVVAQNTTGWDSAKALAEKMYCS